LKGRFSMKRLLTQREVCELLRVQYSTLNRMMNAGDFVSPVNGRGRKLLFCPDTVEEWIKRRQQSVAPTPTTPAKRRRDKKSFEQRQAAAEIALQRHAAER